MTLSADRPMLKYCAFPMPTAVQNHNTVTTAGKSVTILQASDTSEYDLKPILSAVSKTISQPETLLIFKLRSTFLYVLFDNNIICSFARVNESRRRHNVLVLEIAVDKQCVITIKKHGIGFY